MTSSQPPASSSSSAPPPGPISRLHLWGVRNPKWYYIAPPSTLAVAIYVLCLLPKKQFEAISPFSFPGADKIGHMTAYLLLALLTIRGWHREKMPPIALHGFVFALCFVYGFTIEVHQGFSAQRTFELRDLLANAIGALAGLSLWHALMLKWGKRTRRYPGLFRPAVQAAPRARGEGES